MATIAIACANLPFALAWAVLQQPLAIEEGESSVSTPNPKKAPFVSRTQENMTFIHPRLSNAAHYWQPALWSGSFVWGLAAAAFFGTQTSSRLTIGTPQIMSLAAASIFVGTFLAWPWIGAIAFDFLWTVNRP